MDLLITNTPQARQEDLAVARAVLAGFEPSLVLCVTGGAYGHGAPIDGAINTYTPQPLGRFARTAIGSSINLFDGDFALAFVGYARGLVRLDGELAVIRTRASSRGVNGFLSTKRIAREFGGGRLDGLGPRGDMVANLIRAKTGTDRRRSVLCAYLDHFQEVTEARAGRMLEASLCAEIDFALPAAAEIEALERRFGGRKEAFRRQVMEVDAYFVDAGRFKAPILAHILAMLLPRRVISIADIGSGPGIVPMELCLEQRLDIACAVAVDSSRSFQATAEALSGYLDLGGRFEFVTAAAEEFAFGRRFDAISYISSLLHVRKDALRATVDRAFEALAPGGLLIVWENVRSASSATQSDYMFTATSLDTELARLGTVRYFPSTAAMEIPRDKVGDQAVFRVVQKAAA